ncbi:MAG: fumarylacetoacetate hydrolase family protein [Acetobacteraceae bacterium]|nr:fumarylacetoacetate hydrolase family protein [Acetobacteraceae bacterium]
MAQPTAEAVADALWSEWHRGRHMPAEWMGRLSMDTAYRAQLALMDRFAAAGEPQAGWKVGLTAAAMRAQWNIHEPCFGFLLHSGHKPSGHRFRFPGIIAPGFENELCLRIATRLAGPGVTLEQATAAVSHAAPALEIVEKRGPFSEDIALAMADNAQQYAFVTGPEVPLTPANRDLAGATVAVDVNATVIDQAAGAEVMGGGGFLSVQWLANKLAEFGRALEPGMLVMSGSFTRQYPIAQGDRIESRFTPFGTVTATFD